MTPGKKVTNQIRRLSTYFRNYVIWLVTFFADLTVITLSNYSYRSIIFDKSPKVQILQKVPNIQDFLSSSPFLPIFCLNLRKKGWKTHAKAIPFTTQFGSPPVPYNLYDIKKDIENAHFLWDISQKINILPYFIDAIFSRGIRNWPVIWLDKTRVRLNDASATLPICSIETHSVVNSVIVAVEMQDSFVPRRFQNQIMLNTTSSSKFFYKFSIKLIK